MKTHISDKLEIKTKKSFSKQRLKILDVSTHESLDALLLIGVGSLI